MIILQYFLLFFNIIYAKIDNEAKNNTLLEQSCGFEIVFPPIEAPICLRVVQKGQNSTETEIAFHFHIMLVNEFEVQYMECHKDMEATIVPTETCDPRFGPYYFLGDYKANRRRLPDDCPKKCPPPDVILCARSWRNVYRTFLSACYMKMFACNQEPEEKMELIFWQPCAAIAPYLAKLKKQQSKPTKKYSTSSGLMLEDY